MTYQNGKVTIQKTDERNTQSPADERDCSWLYTNIYSESVDNNDCEISSIEAFGMSTIRAYGSISNDPRLNMKALDSIVKDSCKKRSKINYAEFQKKVCGK